MINPYFFSLSMLSVLTFLCVEKSFSVIDMTAATQCAQILRDNPDYKDWFEIPRSDKKEYMDLVKILKEELPEEFEEKTYRDKNFLNEYQKADRVVDPDNSTTLGYVAFGASTGKVMTSGSLLEVMKVIRINFLKNNNVSEK